MAACEEAHAQFDSIANEEAQTGELPEWMHVRGKAFWWVYQGFYDDLGAAWSTFHLKGGEAGVKMMGPPGDIYVCDPDDHEDDPEKMLTVLWTPIE